MDWTNEPQTYTAGQIVDKDDLNDTVSQCLNDLKTAIMLEEAHKITLSSGAAALTSYSHIELEDEDETGADDCDTITGGDEGDIIFVRCFSAAHAITLKAGTGADEPDIGNDIILDDPDYVVCLIHNGTGWNLVCAPFQVRTFTVNAFQYPAPGTDWTPALNGATLGASLAAKKCWLPLNFLKQGDSIVSYKLVGDVVEATAATLDCKLVKINKADPITTTDVGSGAISQVDADGNFDAEATLAALEVVATDKQYTLEILGTTDAGDAITVMGAEVKVIRLT